MYFVEIIFHIRNSFPNEKYVIVLQLKEGFEFCVEKENQLLRQ